MYAAGQQGQRHNVFVRFYRHPVKDEAATLEAGRPIFKDVDYIEKRVPGDNTNVVQRPARKQDIEDFSAVYEKYKAGHETQHDGTPLKEWPAVTRSQVEELAYYHVHTVDQLANVSDAALSNIGPLMALRERARDFIAKARDEAPMQQLRAENEAQKSELAALRQQLQACLEDLRAFKESVTGKTTPVIKGKG